MKFSHLTETLVHLHSPNGNVEINLEKVVTLGSTIFDEKTYNQSKLLMKIFISLGVILIIISSFNYLREEKVPASQVHLVEFRTGFQDYQIQPRGWGTSIYPVHIGDDGSFYYSKNLPVFFVFFIISLGLIGYGYFLYIINIKDTKKYFQEDNHTITLNLGNSVSKSFYVGTKEKTNDVFCDIKEKYERIKMK